MRDLFYVELAKRNEEIRQIEKNSSKEEIKAHNHMLLQTIDEIIHLDHVGRKEGLLSLEERIYHMDRETNKYLPKMIELIVDGTDPKLVEEICLAKYVANGFKGYEGLTYMLQLVGVLAMQAGENPRVIEEKLIAMVPDEVEEILCKRREAEVNSWYEEQSKEIDMTKVHRLYEGEINQKIIDAGYKEVVKLDYLLKEIQDRSLQRALREIDNADLELAMKALSGEGRRRVFINMSKRLCVMIAEDMEDMGRGRTSSIGEATQKVYSIFMRLMDCYEISPEESDEIYALYMEYKRNNP